MVYVHLFNTCSLTRFAVGQNFDNFKKIDAVIAETSLNKLELHLRYLEEEMVPLVFIDANVSHQRKKITL